MNLLFSALGVLSFISLSLFGHIFTYKEMKSSYPNIKITISLTIISSLIGLIIGYCDPSVIHILLLAVIFGCISYTVTCSFEKHVPLIYLSLIPIFLLTLYFYINHNNINIFCGIIMTIPFMITKSIKNQDLSWSQIYFIALGSEIMGFAFAFIYLIGVNLIMAIYSYIKKGNTLLFIPSYACCIAMFTVFQEIK